MKQWDEYGYNGIIIIFIMNVTFFLKASIPQK